MNRTSARQGGQRGFTLIELMIVVAIVAILAAIAYPSYQESVRKGRRAEARTALLELMQQQERYMTQRGTYLVFSNASGTTSPPEATTTFKTFSGDSSPSNYYLSAALCPGSTSARDCIQVIASPTRPDAAVGSLNLTSTGVKDCTGNASATGSAPNPQLCWP
ncbi:MAG: type IV pilin protein [Janthinobacterium lividum]